MSSPEPWSREEEKAFENAVALHWAAGDSDDEPWRKIASLVPSKTLEQLKEHYRILEEDVNAIEAGRVPIPDYVGDEEPASPPAKDRQKRPSCDPAADGGKGGRSRSAEQERKRGTPWTEEEHRLFLLGLEKFGKGDWRSISRNFVISRTPTQVASHAQKYFIRMNSMNRDRRRSSIHDITSATNGDQTPVAGQQAAAAPSPAAVAARHRAPPSAGGLGMYGAPVGQPVSAPPPGHMAAGAAVGTPVMVPPGLHHHHHHHPRYAIPVAYPVAPPAVQP